MRYFFRYILGLPENLVAANLLFGIGIHAALEGHFRAVLVGDALSHDELLGAFWDGWEARQAPEICFGKGEDLSTMGDLADRVLRAFLASDMAKAKGRIIAIEEELRGPVVPGLPDLLARLDLIVDAGDHLTVTDFKTSRSQWDQDQVANSADQLLLYSELVEELADGRPVQLEFVVLTKTKVPSVTCHPVAYDRHQVERAKHIVAQGLAGRRGRAFLPEPIALALPDLPVSRTLFGMDG